MKVLPSSFNLNLVGTLMDGLEVLLLLGFFIKQNNNQDCRKILIVGVTAGTLIGRLIVIPTSNPTIYRYLKFKLLKNHLDLWRVQV